MAIIKLPNRPLANRRFENFDEFWPYYVNEHQSHASRQLHFIGTTNLLLWLFLAAIRRSPRLVIFAVLSSYAFAWIGHLWDPLESTCRHASLSIL